MFMFVVTDMITFKGTFLAIFYGENHIFALIFEMEWCVLFLFRIKMSKNRFGTYLDHNSTNSNITKNGFLTILGFSS